VSAVAAERRHVLVEREFLGGRELAAAAFHQTEILGDAQHPRAHELGLAKLVEVLEDSEQRLLGDLFGVLALAAH